ncbi:uncharacterized protein LOC125869435 [Solanum stenotomum]|uniref:uncharacterized protein LOC125869435 n=1 Tax=Solanum stenotomum TaxID=172797 RepID=UPI0020D04522|nr:uncharacterized protein LOC125869435 [Solanum stenotomum]
MELLLPPSSYRSTRICCRRLWIDCSCRGYQLHFGDWVMTPMGNQRYLRGCGVFAVLDAISAKFAIQKLLADQRYRAYRPLVKTIQSKSSCFAYSSFKTGTLGLYCFY